LRAAGAGRVFREAASRAKTNRRELARDAVAKIGVRARSRYDTWAAYDDRHGRVWRDLIRARTSEGRERAKARGVHMGRPPALTRHQREEAREALANGMATQADLARRFNVSQATISRLTV